MPPTWGFLLCWLTNIYSSSRSLIICSPGSTNTAEQQNIFSSSLILLIFGSGLTNHGISAQQKALAVSSNRMTTVTLQRDKSVWLLFLVTVLLSGLFAFINLFEFLTVGILHQTSGYPFGGEGPTPWYYKSAQLYATVNLVFGLLFFIALAFSCWTFVKVKKSPLFVTLLVTLLLIFIQILNGQSA